MDVLYVKMNPRLKWFQPRLICIFFCFRCKLASLNKGKYKSTSVEIILTWIHFNLQQMYMYRAKRIGHREKDRFSYLNEPIYFVVVGSIELFSYDQ